jgi:hypothetical protein
MVERPPSSQRITFIWDKAHNNEQIDTVEHALADEFPDEYLRANLTFRRNPQTQVDEITLNIHTLKGDAGIKLCSLPLNPGQSRTIPGIIEEVRKVL